MILKISSSSTSQMIKLSLTVKTDDVISATRDVDLHGRLRVVQGWTIIDTIIVIRGDWL